MSVFSVMGNGDQELTCWKKYMGDHYYSSRKEGDSRDGETARGQQEVLGT